MTAEQLKNSILQEAISGRLVPQDSNDEPASALLARIREEKARLVKEGKLKKKDLVDIPITEEEILFEIPASWEWVRLVDIGYFMSGQTPKSEELSSIGNIPYFKVSDMNVEGNELYMNNASLFLTGNAKYKIFPKNAIIYPKNGGALLTNKKRILVKDSLVDLNTGAYVPSNELNITYVYYLFSSIDFRKHHKGTALPTVDMNSINKLIFPLPPLAEQKRIVAKLEELLPIVEQYGKAQKELDELNAALPARLRQSILQEAIQGKLVPQDENDEPADGLKEQLLQAVNNSLFKKRWNSEPIEEEELPFDIPENWKWIRLGDIVYTQTGLSYSKGDLEKKVSNPIRVLRGGNIHSGSWCTKDDDVMIAPEFVKKDIFLKKNSFITPAVTSLEHLGKTALIREDHNDIVAGGFVLYLMPYDDKNDALMEYLAYFFQSAFYNSFCKTITNKSGQAFWNISREKLLKLAIPLPPLAEQQRIVAKIEELFEQIDKITK